VAPAVSRFPGRSHRRLAPRYPCPVRVDRDFHPLVTERLLLRRSAPDDAEGISEYRRVPEVQRFQGWERTDPDAVRSDIEEMSRHAPGESGWVQFSVEVRDDQRLVGDVGLCPVDGEPGVMKIGYTMAPWFQGHGYGTEAVRALVAYAFDVLGAETVRAYASAENLPSVRVAEKAGLRLVERFRRTYGDEVWFGVRHELRRDDRSDAQHPAADA
jgi:RimJ/RimL family protein N-acetyltransferase